MTKQRRYRQILTALVMMGLSSLGLLILSGLNDQIIGKADVALVLGTTVEHDGTPSLRLRTRLDKTIELYRAGYFKTIIVSGGFGKEGYDEAVVMRDYLVAKAIPTADIIVDSLGINTYASAQSTVRILRQRKLNSVFVVTQYFHVPRSRLALKRLGVSPIYSAQANYFEGRDLYSFPREMIGYLYYAVRPYKMDE